MISEARVRFAPRKVIPNIIEVNNITPLRIFNAHGNVTFR